MMKRYYASITPKHSSRSRSIEDLIDELKTYKRELQNKIFIFLDRLLEEGIDVAESNSGTFGQYIIFRKKVTENSNEYLGVLYGYDSKKVMRYWIGEGEKVERYEISPILMAEFGSGWLAQVIGNVQGVGQGTMPNSKGHAKDISGWRYKDARTKEWKHSYGEAPTMPMHRAMVQMMVSVDRIAHEVFGNG